MADLISRWTLFRQNFYEKEPFPWLKNAACCLRIHDLILLVIHGLSVGFFFIVRTGRNILTAEVSSDISKLYFSSYDGASRTDCQSFWVIQRPSARHALSRISRLLDLKTVCFIVGAIGLASIA